MKYAVFSISYLSICKHNLKILFVRDPFATSYLIQLSKINSDPSCKSEGRLSASPGCTALPETYVQRVTRFSGPRSPACVTVCCILHSKGVNPVDDHGNGASGKQKASSQVARIQILLHPQMTETKATETENVHVSNRSVRKGHLSHCDKHHSVFPSRIVFNHDILIW